MPMETPEIGRTPKAGLQRSPHAPKGASRGTPGPDAGFALTLAQRALHDYDLPGENLHDIELGVALLAAKRAGLVGRAPCSTDVAVVMDLFGLRSPQNTAAREDRLRRFPGLAHSYVAQRAFVDAISDAVLRQVPGAVVALVDL